MTIVGYARVSTIDQNLDIQLKALQLFKCGKIFSEKKSGSQQKERPQFQACLDYLREGDMLVVTRIDRLSRSLRDLQNLAHRLREMGVCLKTLEQPVDTSNATGKAFFDMLGVFAEFETNLRRERQMEGVLKAKKEGKYKGRKPTALAKSKQVVELINEGFTREAVAAKLDIGIASVYRILKNHKQHHPEQNLLGSRSNMKIAILEVWLSVENNSKFVRGKKKVREDIELDWQINYEMQKTYPDSWDYILKVSYPSEKELEETVNGLISEAHSLADLRNCFVEMDVCEKQLDKQW